MPKCRHSLSVNTLLRHTRGGFSVLELLVSIVIIGVLIALALPAVQRARDAARQTQCVNNLRNISLALMQFDQTQRRLPASGQYYDPPGGPSGPHHSWAVDVLPYLEQSNLFQQWHADRLLTDPSNTTFTRSSVPVYACPQDISTTGVGDQSYAVNGGWGFTIRTPAGVGDCVVDRQGRWLDLNGDGSTCTGVIETDDLDRKLFRQLGLFFLENWKSRGVMRSWSLDDVHDGTSQTFLVTENVRAGFSPTDPAASFADPNPYRSAFYIGPPCLSAQCLAGQVDYSAANRGAYRINGGLLSAEGTSPSPNSFHAGGVNMAYADGHVGFLSESIDGGVYAALASPLGLMLDGTPLAQTLVSGDF